MEYEKIDDKLIGKGGYSTVYLCKKKGSDSNKRYAMKISEELKNAKNYLQVEYKILQYLLGGIGIPKVYSFGRENNKTNNFYLVQQLLGNNLTQELKKYGNKIPKEIFIKMAIQMISRVEFLHSRGFIHCDIKPENFALNFNKDNNDFTVYLIDFGLVEPYINLKTKEHRKLKEKKGHKGTMNFCSMNSHMELSLSRRDDLESLAYCLIYLWAGKLPWSSGYKVHNNEVILNLKIEFSSYGYDNGDIPSNLMKFLDYVIKLKFEELPNYKYLKDLIREL
jgi:serine/threonine protein kinase